MFDYFANAFRNISRKKLRSFMTVFGIGVGVMSVVLISIISDIGKTAVNSELSSLGIGGVLVSRNAKQKTVNLDQECLAEIRKNNEVESATPLVVNYSTVKMLGNSSECVIWGVDRNVTSIVSLDLVHGRLINQNDIDTMAQVCLVDENYAKKNYHRSNIVGKELRMLLGGSYHKFQVIGVIKTGGNMLQSMMGNVVPCFTYAPYSTIQVMSDETSFGQIMVKAKNYSDTQELSDTLVTDLSDLLGVKNAVKAEDLNTQMDTLNSILNIITVVLTVIAGISLIVAGLSIMTVMLVSVNERTREIGIKKSIGANSRVILMEFITESFLVTLIGSLAGALLAVMIAGIGCACLGISLIINFQTILSCILFAVLVGILFGVYPAMKASRLQPVEALRHQ